MNATNATILKYAKEEETNPIYREVEKRLIENGRISAYSEHDKLVKQAKAQEQSEFMAMYASGQLKEPESNADENDAEPWGIAGQAPNDGAAKGIAGQARNDGAAKGIAGRFPNDGEVYANARHAVEVTAVTPKNILPRQEMKSAVTGVTFEDTKPIIFWYKTKRGTLDIIPTAFVKWLASMGFRRLAGGDENNLRLVRITRHVISYFSADLLVNRVEKIFLNEHNPQELIDNEYTYEQVYSRMIDKIGTLFEHKLLLTLPIAERKAPTTTRTTECYPYRNGLVRITRSETVLMPYKETDYSFFEDEIIPRDFTPLSEQEISQAEFSSFLALTCAKLAPSGAGSADTRKWEVIPEIRAAKIAAIGYLLTHYMDPVCSRAVIFCDSCPSEYGEANGRSGKGLVVKALATIIPTITMNGKSFNPLRDKFAYSQVTPGTRLVCIDDVVRNFSLEPLFSILTEGIQVERKGQNSFRIPYSESPKFVLTMNSVFTGKGGSERARKYEVPFGGFFSADYAPYKHFGHAFFDDWSDEEWNRFDNFMMWCVKYYLKNGLPKFASDDLEKRKIAEICLDSRDLEDYLRGIASALKSGSFIASADLLNDARERVKDLTAEQVKRLNPKLIAQAFFAVCENMKVKVQKMIKKIDAVKTRGYGIE